MLCGWLASAIVGVVAWYGLQAYVGDANARNKQTDAEDGYVFQYLMFDIFEDQ